MSCSELKRKRVVVSRPSKGGCLTCRQRRVKCDQQRPSCHKCAIKGRPCSYSDLKTTNSAPQLLLPNLKSFIDGFQVPKVLSPGLELLSHETQALQYFGTELMPPMFRYSPYVRLARIAFQSCTMDHTVLQAMVAMVLSHRSRVYGHDTTLTTIRGRPASMEAQEQQSKALRAVCLHINQTLACRTSALPVLISCLMLIMFDLFQGDPRSATRHALNMRHILQSASETACMDEELTAINELRYSLTSIDLGPQSITDLDETSQTLFADLEQLLDSGLQLRLRLIERGRRTISARGELNSRALLHCLASCMGRTIWLEHDRASQLQLQRLLTEHDRWHLQLQSSLKQLPVSLQHYARVQYVYSRLTIEALDLGLVRDDAQIELHLTDILTSAEQYLRNFEGSLQPMPRNHFAWSDPSPTISISCNVVRAIYLVSLRSTSAATRLRAIELLYAANRRESTFPSALLAAFAAMMHEILNSDYTDGLPDEIVNAHEHGKGEIFDLTCARVVRDHSGKPSELEMREYHCRDDVEDAPPGVSQVPWALSRTWTERLPVLT